MWESKEENMKNEMDICPHVETDHEIKSENTRLKIFLCIVQNAKENL